MEPSLNYINMKKENKSGNKTEEYNIKGMQNLLPNILGKISKYHLLPK